MRTCEQMFPELTLKAQGERASSCLPVIGLATHFAAVVPADGAGQDKGVPRLAGLLGAVHEPAAGDRGRVGVGDVAGEHDRIAHARRLTAADCDRHSGWN